MASPQVAGSLFFGNTTAQNVRWVTQISWLPDGQRLHMHHGPSDLILQAWARGRDAAYRAAAARFQTVLSGLAEELDLLRAPVSDMLPKGAVARRMHAAAHAPDCGFVTPMAAVAGAVADTVLEAMCAAAPLDKAYVNNGGDIAFHIAGDTRFQIASDTNRFEVTPNSAVRGLATSGWRGRSFSFGIADSVTVLAKTAAQADVAATLIANAVDVPDHPGITRAPADSMLPDSDLGARAVTTNVPPLSKADVQAALNTGLARANDFQARGLIGFAVLSLQVVTVTTQNTDQGLTFHG